MTKTGPRCLRVVPLRQVKLWIRTHWQYEGNGWQQVCRFIIANKLRWRCISSSGTWSSKRLWVTRDIPTKMDVLHWWGTPLFRDALTDDVPALSLQRGECHWQCELETSKFGSKIICIVRSITDKITTDQLIAATARDPTASRFDFHNLGLYLLHSLVWWNRKE